MPEPQSKTVSKYKADEHRGFTERPAAIDAQSAGWLRALEARHLADLRFPEVTRALRALSSAYVERRASLASGAPLAGAGKRAAFALYYAPLHFMLVREIVGLLPGATAIGRTLVDLGCGTGAAGAAWAGAATGRPAIVGLDRHPWAVAEAAWTYRVLSLSGQVRRCDIARGPLPSGSAYLAAFTLNELTDDARARLKQMLLARHHEGAAVLVVEPIARAVTPWWGEWTEGVLPSGGRVDEWRLHVELPSLLRKLATAAGLGTRALTARSIWMPGTGGGERAKVVR